MLCRVFLRETIHESFYKTKKKAKLGSKRNLKHFIIIRSMVTHTLCFGHIRESIHTHTEMDQFYGSTNVSLFVTLASKYYHLCFMRLENISGLKRKGGKISIHHFKPISKFFSDIKDSRRRIHWTQMQQMIWLQFFFLYAYNSILPFNSVFSLLHFFF